MSDLRDRWFQRGVEIKLLRARVAELEAKLKVAEEALLEISQVACSNSPELKISNAALAKIKEASCSPK